MSILERGENRSNRRKTLGELRKLWNFHYRYQTKNDFFPNYSYFWVKMPWLLLCIKKVRNSHIVQSNPVKKSFDDGAAYSLARTHWCIYSKSNNLFPYMPLNFNRLHSLYSLEEISACLNTAKWIFIQLYFAIIWNQNSFPRLLPVINDRL